jgi:hypothetical protein
MENGNSLSVTVGFNAIPAINAEIIVSIIAATRIIVGKNNLYLFIIKYILLINVLLLTRRFSVGYALFYIIYNSLLQTAYKQDVLSGFIKKVTQNG